MIGIIGTKKLAGGIRPPTWLYCMSGSGGLAGTKTSNKQEKLTGPAVGQPSASAATTITIKLLRGTRCSGLRGIGGLKGYLEQFLTDYSYGPLPFSGGCWVAT